MLAFNERQQLNEAVQKVVRRHSALGAVIHELDIQPEACYRLSVALGDAIGNLDERNCNEFGLTVEETRAWIKAGRSADTVPSAPEPDFSEDPGAVIPDIHLRRSKPA